MVWQEHVRVSFTAFCKQGLQDLAIKNHRLAEGTTSCLDSHLQLLFWRGEIVILQRLIWRNHASTERPSFMCRKKPGIKVSCKRPSAVCNSDCSRLAGPLHKGKTCLARPNACLAFLRGTKDGCAWQDNLDTKSP